MVEFPLGFYFFKYFFVTTERINNLENNLLRKIGVFTEYFLGNFFHSENMEKIYLVVFNTYFRMPNIIKNDLGFRSCNGYAFDRKLYFIKNSLKNFSTITFFTPSLIESKIGKLFTLKLQ